MEELKPRIFFFEAPRNIPLINTVELLLNENGIYRDEGQQLRLAQLLEAFDVNRFRYYVQDDKTYIYSIFFGHTEKTASSIECKFANRVLHGNNFFCDVFLNNRILKAIHTNNLLLTNLVNSEVEKFCVTKLLTPFDLLNIDFDLSVYLKHLACNALMYSGKLSLQALSNLSSVERQRLLMIIDNSYVFDAFLTKKINLKEAVLLNVNGRNNHETVIQEITRVKAMTHVPIANDSLKECVSNRLPM